MDFWLEKLEPSSFVAVIVSVGYCLPFMRLPDPRYQCNHKSAWKMHLSLLILFRNRLRGIARWNGTGVQLCAAHCQW